MRVDVNNFIIFLLGLDPDFERDCERYLNFTEGQETVHGIASTFSDFIGKKLRDNRYSKAQAVFNGIETLLAESKGDENIKNALCTCFLENLLNRFTEEPAVLDKFIPLLGPKSIKHSKAWDEFTGVQTHGLWGNEPFKIKNQVNLGDDEALRIIVAIRQQDNSTATEEEDRLRILQQAFPGVLNLIFYDKRKLTPEQVLAEAKKIIKDNHYRDR